jgi:oxalate decarboxylase
MSGLNRRQVIGTAVAAMGGLAAGSSSAEGADKEEGLPTFRYAMEKQVGRVTEGGSAKEATVKQLPISTAIAGVSMRLKPGAIRELHWHANAAEWAFVIGGRVRATVFGPDNQAETNDFDPGEVWYFPRGHGHAVQNMSHEEAHFILVFDNGTFSENGTFSITDWLGHTPHSVLAQGLGLREQEFAKFPRDELYIVNGRVPPEQPEPNRQKFVRTSPLTHRYALMAQQPNSRFAGGEERRVSAREFPISKTMTGVVLDLDGGALREMHWHPHANEWLYIIRGKVRMGLFGSHGRYRVEEFSQGDAGYVPQGFGHYIENHGGSSARLLIVFDKGEYEEISLSGWLAANPVKLTADNFKIADSLVERMPDHRVFVVPKSGIGKDGKGYE